MRDSFTFTIRGRLPCLNEIIAVAQRNRFEYGHFKKQHDTAIGQEIIVQKVPQFTKPVNITITWIEPNARRDLDGITAGTKFILDALVSTSKLPDDGRAWVKSINHRFPPPEKENPRVVVLIEPVGIS